ncbi:unnamed protein product [Malus baccata var. baccata]
MAKLKQILVAISVLLAVLASVPFSECVKKPAAGARKEDIPFIKCQVCEKLASQLHQQVEKKRAEIAPKKKQEADWILQIDIVEKGDKLELVDQGSEGQCNSECKTIERACQEVLGYSDTDVAEYLYTSKPDLGSLVNYLCKDLTKACSTKPPPVPKNRIPGEAFVAKSEKEAEMERIMKSMEGMPGAPGMKMYSKDDLMNMNNFGGKDADDEDDDDDDETLLPSNLGKIMREKESAKNDLKQKITTGIVKTRETLKKHANKVSNWFRQTWRRVKKTASEKSTKGNKGEL